MFLALIPVHDYGHRKCLIVRRNAHGGWTQEWYGPLGGGQRNGTGRWELEWKCCEDAWQPCLAACVTEGISEEQEQGPTGS